MAQHRTPWIARSPLRYRASVASIGVIVLLSACAAGPEYQRPDAPVQAQWSKPALLQAGPAEDFWQQFRDPVLLDLLQQVRSANPSLQSAAVRVLQAQAQLQATRAAATPALQLSSGPTYSKPDFHSQLQGKQDGSTTLQLALQASWEADFWGKASRAAQADQAGYVSGIAALHAARVSLEASTAGAYFNLRTLQLRLHTAQENLSEQTESLRIAEARYAAGATSELDLRQSQAQLEQTRSQLPGLRASIEQLQHALAVLAGRTPDALLNTLAPLTLSSALPSALPAALPRALLQRRPDVLQAELAAVAQSARIGQARAALYPASALAAASATSPATPAAHSWVTFSAGVTRSAP